MRRHLGFVMVLAIALGACRGESNMASAPQASATSTMTPTTRASAAVLQRLITEADLPPGFTRDAQASAREDTRVAASGCPALDAFFEDFTDGATHSAESAYRHGEGRGDADPASDGVRFVSQVVAEWPSLERAETSFEGAAAAFGSCSTFAATDDGTAVTGAMAPLAFPQLGDATTAAHVTFSFGGRDDVSGIEGDIVVIRSGAFVERITVLTYGGAPMPLAELESLARNAAAKL